MKRYTRAQIWEVVIVVSLILLVIYRFALVYDFVPDAYQPSTIFDNIYSGIKQGIKYEADKPGMLEHGAKWTLDHLNAIEKYLHDTDLNYKKAEETAKRCHENMLFRYFMFMGEEQNPSCSERDLKLKEATKDVFEGTKNAPADNTGTPSAAELIPAKTTAPTETNTQGNKPVTPEMVAPFTPATPAVAPTPASVVAPAPVVVPTPAPVTPTPAPQSQNPAGRAGRQPVSVSEPESVPSN